VTSRGFGSRAQFGVRGVRLIADGVPATMPDGAGQAATFSLGSADRIEVMRGPLAALYGNASGGLIQIFTADGPPVPEVGGEIWGGSYGSSRAALRPAGPGRRGQFPRRIFPLYDRRIPRPQRDRRATSRTCACGCGSTTTRS
jgi:outer membrane receptor protein involved in Fe transport